MTEDWLDRVGAIKQWSKGGDRAPHKPLLLLYLFGRVAATGTSEVSYAEAEPVVGRALGEFGPPNPTTPAYPFHHLQTDGLWVVTTPSGESPGASPGKLRDAGAVGRLDPAFETALKNDPTLIPLLARDLLDRNFEESLHAEICAAVGLDLEAVEVSAVRRRAAALRTRSPRFRESVLVAYEYRCAMCGYDGRLGTEAVGLDAAHLRWWAFDGPDDIANSLCLCTFHHKLLDRGAMGVSNDRTVAVSQHFVGHGRAAEELVLALVGQELSPPQRGQPLPAEHHIAWHQGQVFRQPARVE